ncbi:hypothetical protein F1654_04320 [Alkalicaulis satelles]|uniref:BAAT/Acyl-CoA thioester hydrolase C-terminal domain-containing protein n=1 Tax=Alkalicaulis satelles TaxID=2609175 RepID=A0A5M6ZMS1_9PROT|nr:acyl-CoA thioester hydrolase/BAAT C-terminal domain-containing protein [Alkalicaulis satelles]KAA5805215.1 hypothetical protein F1654_04320 [Alkalicaulis satelles]
MLRITGMIGLGAVLSLALVVLLILAAGASQPMSQGPEAAEARRAAFAETFEQLWPDYAGRLPDPAGRFTMRHQHHGFIDGVAVVDFELQDDELPLPPLIIAAGGSNGGFWLGGPGWFPSRQYLGAMLMRSGFSIRSIAHFGGRPLPDWFGEGSLPPRLMEGSLDAIAHVVRDARGTRGAQRRCIGFIGVSKGGELTLLLAGYGEELSGGDGPLMDAAVAVVPSHVVNQSPARTLLIRSSWSMGGEPLEFVRYPWLSPHIPGALMRDYPSVLALSHQLLSQEAAVARAEIPAERAAMPVLLQGAVRDHMWPSAEMSRAAMARAGRLNPGHALEYLEYDLDHFLTSHPEPILDAAAFLYERLRQAAEDGRCEADFRPPGGVDAEPSRDLASG